MASPMYTKSTLAQGLRCQLTMLVVISPLQQRSKRACLFTVALLSASATISVVATQPNFRILCEDRCSRTAARTRSKDVSFRIFWLCGFVAWKRLHESIKTSTGTFRLFSTAFLSNSRSERFQFPSSNCSCTPCSRKCLDRSQPP